MRPYLQYLTRRAGRLAAISLAFISSGCAALNHGVATGGPVMAQERHLFFLVAVLLSNPAGESATQRTDDNRIAVGRFA